MEVAGELFASVALLEDVVEVGGAAGEIGQALPLEVECALAVGDGLVEFAPARGDDGEVHAGLGDAHRALVVPSGRPCWVMTSRACSSARSLSPSMT